MNWCFIQKVDSSGIQQKSCLMDTLSLKTKSNEIVQRIRDKIMHFLISGIMLIQTIM